MTSSGTDRDRARQDALFNDVQAARTDIVDLAISLIRSDSQNPPGDERRVAAVVVDEVARLGLGKATVVGAPDRPNVIVRIPSARPGPTLLLSGHLDTKPAGDLDMWSSGPLDPVIREGFLYGLGAADMKGGVAAMIGAAAAIVRAGGPRAGELILMLTADEESGGAFGARHLVSNGLVGADVALVAEPSGVTRDWECLPVMSRGISVFRFIIRGTQTHSSIWDSTPTVNATIKMSELAIRLQRTLRSYIRFDEHPAAPSGVTITSGVMAHSGVSFGMLSGRAELVCDIRTLPGMSQAGVMADVERFLDDARREDPDLDVALAFEPAPLGWKDALEIDPDHPFMVDLRAAAGRVLGAPPPDGTFPAWTDAYWFQTLAGVPTVSAFGPGLLRHAHSPNERVSVEALAQAAAVYALAVDGYLSGDPEP